MKKTIGRTDKADFPEFELFEIDIKVDTGAYTSSMHCHAMHEAEFNGIKQLSFMLLDPDHPSYTNKSFKTTHYTKKLVKSSNGQAEERFVIRTSIFIFSEEHQIELTLTARGEMKYPILVGRKFLTKRFIVDTARKDLSFKLNNKK